MRYVVALMTFVINRNGRRNYIYTAIYYIFIYYIVWLLWRCLTDFVASVRIICIHDKGLSAENGSQILCYHGSDWEHGENSFKTSTKIIEKSKRGVKIIRIMDCDMHEADTFNFVSPLYVDRWDIQHFRSLAKCFL